MNYGHGQPGRWIVVGRFTQFADPQATVSRREMYTSKRDFATASEARYCALDFQREGAEGVAIFPPIEFRGRPTWDTSGASPELARVLTELIASGERVRLITRRLQGGPFRSQTEWVERELGAGVLVRFRATMRPNEGEGGLLALRYARGGHRFNQRVLPHDLQALWRIEAAKDGRVLWQKAVNRW